LLAFEEQIGILPVEALVAMLIDRQALYANNVPP